MQNTASTTTTPTAPRPRRRRTKPDFGTDRSSAYNKIHNTEIANNHMLDRYLRNKEELERMPAPRASKVVYSSEGRKKIQ